MESSLDSGGQVEQDVSSFFVRRTYLSCLLFALPFLLRNLGWLEWSLPLSLLYLSTISSDK